MPLHLDFFLSAHPESRSRNAGLLDSVRPEAGFHRSRGVKVAARSTQATQQWSANPAITVEISQSLDDVDDLFRFIGLQ